MPQEFIFNDGMAAAAPEPPTLDEFVTGEVVGTSVLTGAFTLTSPYTLLGAVIGTPVLLEGASSKVVTGTSILTGVFRLTGTSGESPVVLGMSILSGSLVLSSTPATDPEGRRDTLGYRPTLPLIIHSVTIETTAHIMAANIPVGKHFAMASAYRPTSGDGLYEYGALPGYIGTRLSGGYQFRRPEEREVAWYISLNVSSLPSADNGLYRYDNERWLEYKSAPERALDGMRVFDFADPEGAWMFVARLIGAAEVQLQWDNRDLSRLHDPDYTPVDLLPVLADQWSHEVLPTQSELFKRQLLRTALSRNRSRGLDEVIPPLLYLAGYTGYVREIWVNADAATNFTEYADAPAATQTLIEAAGLENALDPDNGAKGTDWFERPHGYNNSPVDIVTSVGGATITLDAGNAMSLDDGNALPLDGTVAVSHVPSSRLVLHVNFADGTPLPFLSESHRAQVYNEVVNVVREFLPAHVDIRMITTDVSVVDGDQGVEAVGVADTINFVE